jgi:hypothetical protein
MLNPAAYSTALPAKCRGAFVAYNTDGTITFFAGTATDLYTLNIGALTWTKVSKGGSSYTTLGPDQQWQFTQFNNYVIAVQIATAPQMYNLASPGNFVDLAGTPPSARYVTTVGQFVVLSGLYPNAYRIQWSGISDPLQWTSGVEQSDYQDLPDGGVVRGVAGGETGGIIFQDNAIRRMTFAPGTDYVFQIERISQDKGLYAPYSLVRAGERIFWLNNTGFHKIEPGSNYPVEIGKEKFDRYVLSNTDRTNLQLVIGVADRRSSRVFWSYGTSGAGTYSNILCYDYLLDRASTVPMLGQYLVPIAQQISGASNPSTAPDIGEFNQNNYLCFFTGGAVEATLDTGEQGTDGTRVRVQGIRPITDAPTVYGSCSYRENTTSALSFTTESQMLANGWCPLNRSTRYSRGRIRIPAGTTWTRAIGIEPMFATEGKF